MAGRSGQVGRWVWLFDGRGGGEAGEVVDVAVVSWAAGALVGSVVVAGCPPVSASGCPRKGAWPRIGSRPLSFHNRRAPWYPDGVGRAAAVLLLTVILAGMLGWVLLSVEIAVRTVPAIDRATVRAWHAITRKATR